ncbi:MAG: hypothetical protein V8T23_07555 [Prevotella sp.]
MAIKYEIHSIHNSKGEGGEQKFVRLRDHEPMTSKQIEEHIEQVCSLTRADVQAVMTALHGLIVTELSQGPASIFRKWAISPCLLQQSCRKARRWKR